MAVRKQRKGDVIPPAGIVHGVIIGANVKRVCLTQQNSYAGRHYCTLHCDNMVNVQ